MWNNSLCKYVITDVFILNGKFNLGNYFGDKNTFWIFTLINCLILQVGQGPIPWAKHL